MGELSTNHVLIYLMSVPTNSLSKLSQKNASHLKSITHILKIESRIHHSHYLGHVCNDKQNVPRITPTLYGKVSHFILENKHVVTLIII